MLYFNSVLNKKIIFAGINENVLSYLDELLEELLEWVSDVSIRKV